MRREKIFAGQRIRDARKRLGLTQKGFAERLGVSLPYLNQMENNHRPLSRAVIVGLAREFDIDLGEMTAGDSARLVADLSEALTDGAVTTAPSSADLHVLASQAPSAARALLDLHRAYRQSQERLAALDEALGQDDRGPHLSPWEEVRDFFHYCNNYIDAIDQVAEQAAQKDIDAAMAEALAAHGVTLRYVPMRALRHYDPNTRTLTLSNQASRGTQRFQLCHQAALITQAPLIDATLDLASFQTDTARSIARVGLANYFAGAAILPYGRFHARARALRHDIEQLAQEFGASMEQVAHRLSTLQRPGAEGVPFFFVRVDQAGTITKRHSATSLQFARFGGACPLWNVHRAFETPGQFLRQLAQTSDGTQYICLARDISRPGGAWGAPVRRFAIGLGCEVRHAHHLVYADTLDVTTPAAFEPIGISCRICERADCHQRSVPPMERRLSVDPNERGTLPYRVS